MPSVIQVDETTSEKIRHQDTTCLSTSRPNNSTISWAVGTRRGTTTVPAESTRSGTTLSLQYKHDPNDAESYLDGLLL
jgi:hypothetical protein